jgi:hypothetical protein
MIVLSKLFSPLAIALAIAAPATAQQLAPPQTFSIKGGETLYLSPVGSTTNDCASAFASLESLDILEGPPEITLKFEPMPPGTVMIYSLGGKVCKGQDGGKLMITAKPITEKKTASFTVRVNYRIKHTSAPHYFTLRYNLLMFPGGEEASKI